MSEWISVKDRMPEYDQIVLAWYCKEDNLVIKARFEEGFDKQHDFFDSAEFEEYPEVLLPGEHISHWQQLPEPPK